MRGGDGRMQPTIIAIVGHANVGRCSGSDDV
jgi:hypothetical protein